MNVKASLSSLIPIRTKIIGDDEKTVKEIKKLLVLAENRVVWSTSFHPNLFDRPDIKELMNNAIARGIHFDMLIGKSVSNPNTQPERYEWLMNLQRDRVNQLTIKKTDSEIRHYIIVDSKHIRIEEKHPYNVCGNENDIIYNTILARYIELKFLNDSMWTTEAPLLTTINPRITARQPEN